MATRRPRIKAVVSLPTRRKNKDNESDQIRCYTNTKLVQNKSATEVIDEDTSEIQHIENTSDKPIESSSEKQTLDSTEIQSHNNTEIQTDRFAEQQPEEGTEKQECVTTTEKQECETTIEKQKCETTTEKQIENTTGEKKIEKNTETRRARIKAIVSIPARRKNAGSKNALEGVKVDITETYKESQTVVTIGSDTEQHIDKTTDNQIDNSINTTTVDPADNINEKVVQSENDINRTNTYIVQDDYNPPSIPESITDETVDGIVPFKPAGNAAKPLDLLKNEIISENVEVLFDPIVPLPSPSKVRPKLRPVPRLGPFRRNSIQGSASESEDESRRVLLSGGTPTPTRQRHDSHTSHITLQSAPHREVVRVRNDSVCSNVSQTTPAPSTSSLLKEKTVKTRRDEIPRRIAAKRRQMESFQRDQLTMYDLIYYNPTSKPMVIDEADLKVKDKAESKETLTQESEDSADEGKDEKDAAPVPQIKLGPNGEIVLDEKSLVIKQSKDRKISKSVVHEGAFGRRVGRYHRNARTKRWTTTETVRFYRALAALGTDFSLMEALFPDRTRRDLKIKFKKEERLNPVQIDKALRTRAMWDMVEIEKEFTEERQQEARAAEREKERLAEFKRESKERAKKAKKMNARNSYGARAIGHVVEPCVGAPTYTTTDDILQIAARGERRKRKNMNRNEMLHQTPNTQEVTDIGLNQSNNTMTSTEHMPTTVTTNIESGSLVLLTVNDPSRSSNNVVHTYVSNSEGFLTPVTLPSTLMNSVVGQVNNGTPPRSSPIICLPISTVNQECQASSVIQLNPSPRKRIRHSSYTITQL